MEIGYFQIKTHSFFLLELCVLRGKLCTATQVQPISNGYRPLIQQIMTYITCLQIKIHLYLIQWEINTRILSHGRLNGTRTTQRDNKRRTG